MVSGLAVYSFSAVLPSNAGVIASLPLLPGTMLFDHQVAVRQRIRERHPFESRKRRVRGSRDLRGRPVDFDRNRKRIAVLVGVFPRTRKQGAVFGQQRI